MYAVYREGLGLYRAYRPEKFRGGLTWKQAHNLVVALNKTSANFTYWMSYDKKDKQDYVSWRKRYLINR